MDVPIRNLSANVLGPVKMGLCPGTLEDEVKMVKRKSMSNFEKAYRRTLGWWVRRRLSPELVELLRPLYEELIRRPPDLAAIKESLLNLLSFLASAEGRTDANCKAVACFLCVRDYWERDFSDLPEAWNEVLDDVGGCLHDTVNHPEVAENFDSTPEQLLERTGRLKVE